MKNEQILLTPNMFFVLKLVFLFGTTTVLPIAPGTGHDAWLSMIIAIVIGLGMESVCAYIFSKFPNTHWVDILQKVFGKIVGTAFVLFYIGVAITLIAYGLRDFEAFLTSVSYFKTPFLVIGGTYIALH
jgi:spore germination protein KB